MHATRLDPLATLRRHRLLRAWLSALVLATVLSGLHAAMHVGAMLSSQTTASAPATGGHGGDDGDCAACRLGAGLAMALWAGGLLLAVGTAHEPSAAAPFSTAWADAVTRWRQRRKHGPPALPR
jgi:hypothetical protein